MEKSCLKCEIIMVEAKIDSYPIRVYKTSEKPNVKTMSNISACYVCPNCGIIEFYADEPEKFK